MSIIPPRVSNDSERLPPTSENKVLPWQSWWTMIGISCENTTKYQNKRSDRVCGSISLITILSSKQDTLQAAHEEGGQVDLQMQHLTVTWHSCCLQVPARVQLEGRMENMSICSSQDDYDGYLEYDIVDFLRKVRNYTSSQPSTHLFLRNTHVRNATIL
jgi:hypothetical protein